MLNELEQLSLGIRERSVVQVSASQGLNGGVGGSLQLQEMLVAAGSIAALVQGRDECGDHLFLSPVEEPIGELQGIRDVHDRLE